MGVGRGFGFFFAGLRMWRRRPGLMLLGVLPALLVLAVLATLFVLLLVFADDLVGWATPFADDWGSFRTVFRFLLTLILVVGGGFLAIVTFTGLTLAVGDPFYEKIWRETELMLGGEVPDHGVGWLRGARDGLVLVGLGVVTSVCVFAVGLLPVVGTVVGAVLGLVVSGRLLAGELVSRGLEARGMDRVARKQLLQAHSGAMTGFGVAVQMCFLIPFGAVLVMPGAVAGATMLAREALDAAGPVVPGVAATR